MDADKLLAGIPKDKRLHFAAGLGLSLLYPLLPLWFSACVICLVAVGKELWDFCGHGTAEVMDALATILGGALGLLVLTLLV